MRLYGRFRAPRIGRLDVIALKRACGGTQNAAVGLNADAAKILLRAGLYAGFMRETFRRSASGACSLGIWPVIAKVRLTARELAVSAGRRGILLEIAKGNLCMFRKVGDPKSANHIAGSESVRNF